MFINAFEINRRKSEIDFRLYLNLTDRVREIIHISPPPLSHRQTYIFPGMGYLFTDISAHFEISVIGISKSQDR